jgi:plasmid stabilization system protein ParE
MKFQLSDQAAEALEALWEYYVARGGTKLADRVLAEIHDSIEKLIERPGLGHHRPDLTDKPLRFYRVYDVLLIYDPASSPLYIARVYHPSQDVRRRLRDEAD